MTISRVLIVIGAAIILAAINVSIVGKERVIRDGTVVYLELGPRDPRSLMQGDYMALRFELARQIESKLQAGGGTAQPSEGETGVADIALDDKGIATLAMDGGAAPNAKLRYRIRKGRVWLGTNAFFFEEGKDMQYAPARYGEFRLDKASGEAVLVGLRDGELKAL